MATIGDPLMDLGTTLGYWVDGRRPRCCACSPPALPRSPATSPGPRWSSATRGDRPQYVRRSDAVFYYVFGLFKIAVIAQQIYYRFQQGLTKDARFAAMITSVRLLGRTAVSALDKGRIDRLG